MKRKGINAAFIGEEQQDQQVISTIRAGDIPLVYGSLEAICLECVIDVQLMKSKM